MGESAEALEYVGFWPRAAALLIDSVVLLPLGVLFTWVKGLGRDAAIVGVVLPFAIAATYRVWFTANRGGTLGKLAQRLRITASDGAPIGWSATMRREAVNLVFGAVSAGVAVLPILLVDEATFSKTGLNLVTTLGRPSWHWVIDTVWAVWVYVSIAFVVFTKQHRALHDYLADTVVVRRPPAEQALQPDAHESD